MRSVIVVCFVLVLMEYTKVNAKPVETSEESYFRRFLEELTEECYEDKAGTIKVELTDETFEEFQSETVDPSRNVKCVMYCIAQGMNYFNGSILNVDKTLEDLQEFSSQDLDLNVIRSILVECNSEVEASDDNCEIAYELDKCIDKKSLDQGIDYVFSIS